MQHENGMSIREAAATAAHLRFRPIVMTSLAFILGCLPLALSVGAGAASRHSIGTGIVGGMLAATGIAIFFVPSFFSIIMRLTSKEDSPPEKDKKSLSEEEKTALDPTSEGGVN